MNNWSLFVIIAVWFLGFTALSLIYKNFVKNAYGYIGNMPVLFHLLLALLTVFIPYIVMYKYWLSKEKNSVFCSVINNPCEDTVNDLIAFLKSISETKNSKEKEEMKIIWEKINECETISEALKKRANEMLKSKGM